MDKTISSKVGRCTLTGRFIKVKEAEKRKNTAVIELIRKPKSKCKHSELSGSMS